MGRQIDKIDLAYIAGFLDGDGSIIVQVKNRSDSKRGWRLMFTICFYQDTRHEKPLFWIKKTLGIGYISRRNDGMTELRINGFDKVRNILNQLYPYFKFKKKQARYILKILDLLKDHKSLFKLDKKQRRRVANSILKARQESYQSGSKKIEKLKLDLRKIINLSP